MFSMVKWWRLVCCKISFRAWFIPLDAVLAGLKLHCLTSENHCCSVPCWEQFAFFAIQNLSEVKKNGKNLYPFQCTYLDWTSCLFSCMNLCVACSKKYQPLTTHFLTIHKGKGNSSHMYANLVTSSINNLNILLPTDCSVMPCGSSAALFYFLWELCSIFGINPLAWNFPIAAPLLFH